VDRSAFAHCTVALKQAQRGWYIHRLLQNFLRRFSSLAGVLQTPTRARPRNKKVSFDLPRNYLRAGRSRWAFALVIFEVTRNISQTVTCHVSSDLLTPPAGQRKRGVSQNAETELLHPFRADSRARCVTTRSHRDVTIIAPIFKEIN